MAIFVKPVDEPFGLTESEFKTYNGFVITQGEVGLILSEINRQVNEMIEKDWLEAVLRAFGISVQGAVETWLKAILGGSIGGRLAKLILSSRSVLATALIAVLRLIWGQVSEELMKQFVNGLVNTAWAVVEEKRLPH